MHWMPMAGQILGALIAAGSYFAQAVAPAAATALWQGAAIALFLGFCLKLAPRMSAAQRFAMWAAAFVAVAGLPVLPWFARGATIGLPANAHLGASAPAPWFQLPQIQLDDRWALAIAALWLIASVVRASSLAAQALRLGRLWKCASPVETDAKLRTLIDEAFAARRTVELCTTRELDRPSVIGFFAPRILIPDWLFARLSAAELKQVVLHEAEHLRRRDEWTNLALKLALVLFPLNPALAWIEKRLCREREMACDEGVVRRTLAPNAYAACLASLAEHGLERRRAHALSLGVFERRPELVRRVSSLLARKRGFHPLAARALMGVAACGLLIASVELARCPQIVAFVPAAPAAMQQNQVAQADLAPLAGNADRVFVQPEIARGASGFNAVETRAVLRAGRGDAPLVRTSSRSIVVPRAKSEDAFDRQIASNDAVVDHAAPRAVLLKVEMPHSDSARAGRVADSGANGQTANSGFAGRAEVVVLTAWEEVRTSPHNARLVADYDTGTGTDVPQSAGSENQAAYATGRQPAVQITVTRLIFLIDSRPIAIGSLAPGAGVRSNSAPPSQLRHPANSDYSRSSASPPVSEWLVLQL